MSEQQTRPGEEEEEHVHQHDGSCDHDHHHHHPPPRRVVKIGRNEPCPCGSGRKYKKCCIGAEP